VIRMIRAAFPSTRVLAHDVAPDHAFGSEMDLRWVDPPTIYAEADIVTVHVPLTAQTRNLIAARELSQMKRNALLINTARGEIVNEADLAKALGEGQLQGAAIDVFENEPYAGELAGLE